MSTVVDKTRVDASGNRKLVEVHSTVAPGVGDDNSLDYAVGTTWTVRDADNVELKRYMCVAATKGAADWREYLGGLPGRQTFAYEDTVVLGGAVASANFAKQLPAGAVIIQAEGNLDAAVTATTAVKVGLGKAGTITGLGLFATLTKNTRCTASRAIAADALVGVPLAAATTLAAFACATDGTAAGTINAGTIRMRVVYEVATLLADAA